MNVKWYLNRLRSMSAAEMIHRFAEKGKKTLARGRLEDWDKYLHEGCLPNLPGLKKSLKAQSKRLSSPVAEAAKMQMLGNYAALGVSWPQKNSPQNFKKDLWRLDPVSGGLWPGNNQYCFDISYRHERELGDIKYVWEYNRLQFLQPLAAHALLTGSEPAIEMIENAISSWYENSPPFRGIGWNSGIELSLRAISLLVVVSLCGDRLNPQVQQQIANIIKAHAFWIDRFPSLYSSANNHLVAEAAALFLISLAMPDLEKAGHYEKKGAEMLAQSARDQILDDGIGAEQSPTYGAFTAEFLLLCAFTGKAAGKPLPEIVTSRLESFSSYIGWIADKIGNVPSIGDDDEGRVLSLCQPEPFYAMSVAGAIAGFCKIEAPQASQKIIELRDLVNQQDKIFSEKMTGIKTFEKGGYTVIRDVMNKRQVNLQIDHGPLGYLSIAAHGHADALSLTLSIDDIPVLVDPGTYLYHSGGDWRDWFRGTPAHNTVNIDSSDQSEISGTFNWLSKANAQLDKIQSGPEWKVYASHDGYEERYGLRHQRILEVNSNGFSVIDKFLHGKSSEAEIVFQLADNCSADIDGQNVLVLQAGKRILELYFNTEGIITTKSGGELGDGGGWISPEFGRKIPAVRVSWKGIIPEEGIRTDIKI